MAGKKPKTPPPPRSVQAPRQRKDTRKGGSPDRERTALYAIAGVGVVALIAVVAFLALGNKSSTAGDAKVAAAMSSAGCSFKTVKAYVPAGQGTHVDSLTAKLPWNTDPPSNGQHYPLWAVWGFYTEPVNPRQVVHDEEHGGVILWWGSKVPASTIAELRAFYDEQPDGSFGTSYPKLGSKIAITAWTGDPSHYQQNGYYGQGHIGICTHYTPAVKAAFTSFRNAYRGHGPEGIPLSDDEPGDGPPTS